jgi:hypothetical protein
VTGARWGISFFGFKKTGFALNIFGSNFELIEMLLFLVFGIHISP